MRTKGLLLSVAVLLSPLCHARTGEFQPAMPGVIAEGTVEILQDSSAEEVDRVEFQPDFRVSRGVILNVKVCGQVIASDPGSVACISLGELRKTEGAQSFRVRRRLETYSRVVIFDVDLAADHAVAKILAPALH